MNRHVAIVHFFWVFEPYVELSNAFPVRIKKKTCSRSLRVNLNLLVAKNIFDCVFVRGNSLAEQT